MPAPSSTRWRLNISVSWAGGNTSFATLAMASSLGGADLCTGGTASAQSIYGSGYEADKAFDGNAGTRWNNNASSSPTWLEYQFASAVAIVEYTIQAGSDYWAGSPKTWTFEYWDGSSWVVGDTQTNQPSWTSGEIRTFSISISTDPAASVRATQLVAETLSLPTPAARTTQLVVEVLTSTSAVAAVERVESFVWMPL